MPASVLKKQINCLAGGGFGNRLCYLETTSNAQNCPPDLGPCAFILEQSLSVRALQEMRLHVDMSEKYMGGGREGRRKGGMDGREGGGMEDTGSLDART
ncbi:unnamed protein product [Coregonus sp. 'balchen']|nr:unnamed protein product [Coregonus sp. 'balchen']